MLSDPSYFLYFVARHEIMTKHKKIGRIHEKSHALYNLALGKAKDPA